MPSVMIAKIIVATTYIQSCLDTLNSSVVPSSNLNKFIPKIDYEFVRTNFVLGYWDIVLTDTRLAGKYISVSIVTTLTVALSTKLLLPS